MKHGLLLSLLAALLAVPAAMPARAGGPLPSEQQVTATVPAGDTDEENEAYSLSAAYPNPFHTRTQFDLRVDETQRISVEVYNILGQRVRTLYKGLVRGDTPRTFTFKARNLPSGLYLYRISGETFAAARRVTLVR